MWCQQQRRRRLRNTDIRWMVEKEKRHLLWEAAGAIATAAVHKDLYIDCRILNKILKKTLKTQENV